jgi:hypothetical protein
LRRGVGRAPDQRTTVEGTIVDFTPYTVRLRGGDGDEVTVRKLAIAYYQTKGPVDDAQ